MADMDLLDGVTSEVVDTSRLETHLLASGPEEHPPQPMVSQMRAVLDA
ncbi:MAG: hypothetical protein WA982_13945 [Rubrobacteraceae bacterium]